MNTIPLPLLAQVVVPAGIPGWLILIIILAACIAIALVAVRAMGINVPGWVTQIGWIIVIAIVAVLAIKLVAGMF